MSKSTPNPDPKRSGDYLGPQSADGIDAAPIEWLWEKRIPRGMISVVAGKPNQGKGLFATHLASAVSRKGEAVLYSAIEDDPARMTRPRLEAANADLSNVHIWGFRLPAQFAELRAHVLELGISLIIIDPLNAHLSGGVSRTSDSIRDVTTPLARLAEEANAAVVVIEHAIKRVASNAHPLDAIGGSGSGVPAAARMAYMLGVDPDNADQRILAPIKSNLRATPKAVVFETDSEEFDGIGEVPSLLKQGETEFDAKRLLVQPEEGAAGPKPDKRAQAAEWLTKYLDAAGKPVKAGQVLTDGGDKGLAKKTLRRAAADMGVVKNPPKGGRNVTWDLPPEVKQALAAAKGGQS